METGRPLIGRISARQCPTCGHHEMGYVAQDGMFYPLKQGDTIQIVQKAKQDDGSGIASGIHPEVPARREAGFKEFTAWIPDALRHDRHFRIKFGVMVDSRLIQNGMTGAVYDLAFRQKLQELIETAVYVPLPVILDRFFNAPHLAAGTSKEVADALLEELDEVKEPVQRMLEWLGNPGSDTLKRLIHPKELEDYKEASFSEEAFKQELIDLNLEDFFELL